MNNGYIQSKQRELNAELKRVEERTKTLQQRIEVMDEKIVEYDALISVLKKQEKFQEQLKEDILKESKRITKEWIQSSELNKIVTGSINSRLRINFNEASDDLVKVAKSYKKRVEALQKSHDEHVLLFNMLTDKLVMKGVLSNGELVKILSQVLNLDKKTMLKKNKEAMKYNRQKLRKQLMR